MGKFFATLAFALMFSIGAQAQNNNGKQAAVGPDTVAEAPATIVVKQWKTKGELIGASRQNFHCKTNTVHYDFVLYSGNRLDITTGSNTHTVAVVEDNGAVDHSFQSNLDARLRLIGNINSPATMKVLNTDGNGCEWGLSLIGQ